MTNTKAEIESKKYIFRKINLLELGWINFISVTEKREKVFITITYSYTKYHFKDNYKLVSRQKQIEEVHKSLINILRAITGKLIQISEIEVGAIDISNQLEVDNIKNYYNVLDIIYRAYKNINPNGRLYFDTDKDKRKQLDGLDFRERGKKRRESSNYFKIYSKRKEIEDTKGHSAALGKATALRGELTLKGHILSKYNLNRLAGIQKENLERVLQNTLAEMLIQQINKELEKNINTLTKEALKGTSRLRERIQALEYFVFDIKLLDIVLIEENLKIKKRAIQYQKTSILEGLSLLEKNGEVKKTYSKNFERLSKLLKKIAKIDIKEVKENKEVRIEWQRKD